MLRDDSESQTPVAVVWRAIWTSRLVVLLSGMFALLSFGRRPGTEAFDPANLTAPFGYFGNLLAAPFARWDSVWYLAIAQGGYDHEATRTAFFPLYPLVLRAPGVIIGSDLIAGVLVSLVAFAVALLLLHRLVSLELGRPLASVTVMLVAFCPMSYFFSAVYSESLFLALSVGCVLQARLGRWAWAGVLGALGAASRNSGIALMVPILLLFLYGPRGDRAPTRRPVTRLQRLLPRYPITRSILWVGLVPVGLGAYLGWLALKTGDGLAPFHVQQVWFRHFAGPFGGVWTGAVAAWDGLRQLLHGPPPPLYFTKAGGDPMMVAGQNLMLFAFLALGVAGLVGALRRLPIAYGAYAIVALAFPLSYPVTPQPLASLPRYEVVVFPLFMWAAWWLQRRRLTTAAIGALAVLLDALGTLLELEPPAPRLRTELLQRFGVQISETDAQRAIAAEIAYYRAHLDQGRDPVALAALRSRCAEALREGLPDDERIGAIDNAELTSALLASLRFEPFSDVRPALAAARAAGRRLVVLSNWDVSLNEVLERLGLAQMLDGIVTSAAFGVRKPSPEIFEHALGVAGVAAHDALHVGDSLAEDVAGARAAGIEAVLIKRDGEPGPPGVRTIATLAAAV
jgi:HAD superfamily hydrolase (TIGR01509 family)